jgi:hypothetical protein
MLSCMCPSLVNHTHTRSDRPAGSSRRRAACRRVEGTIIIYYSLLYRGRKRTQQMMMVATISDTTPRTNKPWPKLQQQIMAACPEHHNKEHIADRRRIRSQDRRRRRKEVREKSPPSPEEPSPEQFQRIQRLELARRADPKALRRKCQVVEENHLTANRRLYLRASEGNRRLLLEAINQDIPKWWLLHDSSLMGFRLGGCRCRIFETGWIFALSTCCFGWGNGITKDVNYEILVHSQLDSICIRKSKCSVP